MSGGIIPKVPKPALDYAKFYDIDPQRSESIQEVVPAQSQGYDTFGAELIAVMPVGITSNTYVFEILKRQVLVAICDISLMAYGGNIDFFFVRFKIVRNAKTLFYFHRYLAASTQIFGEGIPLPSILLEKGDQLIGDYGGSTGTGFNIRLSMQVQGLLVGTP